MVYCTKCGTNNADDATACVKCGAPLHGASGEGRTYMGRVRYERHYGYHRRGRPFIGIFIGLIIILAGFSLLVAEFYRIDIPWFPIVLILIGVFILLRLILARSRRR